MTLSVMHRMYYKNIHLVGEENLPANKPVIIASTHTNSFLDGVMVMSIMERMTYALARGDAFLHPKFNRVLRSMNLLPIFRATDADPRESVRRNNETFDETYDILKRNKALIIFSEAISVPAKKVRTVRKGTARLAVDMMKRSGMDMDLQVVPLGMNYGHFKGPRKSVTMKFGKAIPLRDYVEEISNTEAKFVNHLTRILTQEFKGQMVISPDGKEEEFDELLEITNSEKPIDPLVQFDRTDREFAYEKQVSEKVLEEPDEILDKVSAYTEKRDAADLKEYKRYSSTQKWLQATHFAFTIIPSLLTMLLHGWIMPMAGRLTPGKIKTPVFFDSVYIGIALIGTYVAALVFFPVSFLTYGWGGVLIYWVLRWSMPSFYQNKEFLANISEKMKWQRLEKSDPGLYNELTTLRRDILNDVVPAAE